ncbi:MAMMALIAN LYST-INTERACTING PROTEIN 5-like protein [Iris pallida]|uniref:MAMMALIAN LYST-INTERACTING PROTEIN 5-like protein n=1 Tax=Iris pallida TaxID=29817 RepID=A0AAX6I7F3_IRIPA|nr:protein MAMMALIAN LYST-INTERACTING PROTEIN 5-like protein [Iris pallida]KAJ6849139.1 MAMMALIAN LYST-INTERACTING PROTEIN 5-like protein [Iris pallida]
MKSPGTRLVPNSRPCLLARKVRDHREYWKPYRTLNPEDGMLNVKTCPTIKNLVVCSLQRSRNLVLCFPWNLFLFHTSRILLANMNLILHKH